MKRVSGAIEYELTYKKVRRLNLRVRADNRVAVSAPARVPVGEIDQFVVSHAGWIEKARARFSAQPQPPLCDLFDDECCLAAFRPVFERYWAIFSDRLAQKPELCVRFMKTRWGVCYPRKNRITLNKQLLSKSAEALEYVVLHEFVHFFHPDHQAGFHRAMASLMPDYKMRRKRLRENS